MNFEELVHLFDQTHRTLQQRAAQSVDITMLARNWLFGWYIKEYEQNGNDRAQYGTRLIVQLSQSLTKIGIKGCSESTLRRYRRFYESYPAIRSTVLTELPALHNTLLFNNLDLSRALSSGLNGLTSHFQLSWSHYLILLQIDNLEERNFYEIEAIQNAWGVRELQRQVSSALYERLQLSRDKQQIKQLATHGQIIAKPNDLIKDPMVLEFLDLEQRASYSENDLELAIIDQLEHFLLELGKGFLFEARQKRFSFEEDHFYVDLVFYNRLLRCYVLIDLKIDKLMHQDLGQMQMYVNYFDRHVKTPDETPTIGIVLCKRKNDALVKLTLPEESNIYASKYQLYLPSKEELQQQIEQAARRLEAKNDEPMIE